MNELGAALVFATPWLGLAGLGLAALAFWPERWAQSSRAMRRLRVAILGCLALAAAGPEWRVGNPPAVILVPDDGAPGAERMVTETLAGQLVVGYGSDRRAPGPDDEAAAAGRQNGESTAPQERSDEAAGLGRRIDEVAAGLAAGSRLVVAASPRRVLADGWRAAVQADESWWDVSPAEVTPGRGADNAFASARRAAAAGILIDVLDIGDATDGVHVAVSGLTLPAVIWPGEPLPASVSLRASAATSLTLAWRIDNRSVDEAAVPVPAGLSQHSVLLDAPGDQGARAAPADFEAHVVSVLAAPKDEPLGAGRAAPTLQPNSAARTVFVSRPPRVLVIGDGSGAVGLADLLSQAGLPVTVVGPLNAPTRRTAYLAYDAAVLVDLPADAFGVDQLAALRDFVGLDGRGLLLVGGRQSYLAGGWEGTALERLAPVRLEPPTREEHAVVALLLMLDTSASMGSVEGRAGLRKIDLAREAALLATDPLRADDRVGVVAYADDASWLAPFASLVASTSGDDASRAGLVNPPPTAGGTRMIAGLQLGLPALAAEPASSRHALLVSDGRDASPPNADFDGVLRAARAAGVTLSTIAIGADADTELLARLARLGGGRFHRAADPGDLPRLALEESKLVRSRALQTGEVRARQAMAGQPALLGVDVAALPALNGYVALTRRAGAEVVLETPNGDPLLASWNWGAGRVAAWAGDAGESWAADWLQAPAGRAFWRRLAHYLARRPLPDGAAAASSGTGRSAWVVADLRDALGEPADGASVALSDSVNAKPSAPGASLPTLQALLALAPGFFGTQIAVPAAPRALYLHVHMDGAQAQQDAPRVQGAAAQSTTGGDAADRPPLQARPSVLPLALDPPAPAWPAIAPPESGAVLAELAAAGGGRLLASRAELPAGGGTETHRLWPFLVAMAASLWLVHVAQLVGRWPPRAWPRLARRQRP